MNMNKYSFIEEVNKLCSAYLPKISFFKKNKYIFEYSLPGFKSYWDGLLYTEVN